MRTSDTHTHCCVPQLHSRHGQHPTSPRGGCLCAGPQDRSLVSTAQRLDCALRESSWAGLRPSGGEAPAAGRDAGWRHGAQQPPALVEAKGHDSLPQPLTWAGWGKRQVARRGRAVVEGLTGGRRQWSVCWRIALASSVEARENWRHADVQVPPAGVPYVVCRRKYGYAARHHRRIVASVPIPSHGTALPAAPAVFNADTVRRNAP